MMFIHCKDSAYVLLFLCLQPFGKETLGTAGLVIIPIMVSASAFGAANSSLFISSRILYVTAREGQAPKFLSGLHSTAKTPVPAILVMVSCLWEAV